MRVGVDVFTFHPLKLSAPAQLELAREMELDGVQLGSLRHISPTLDPGALQALRQHADSLGLYSHPSLSITCDPYLAKVPPAEQRERLSADIAAAAACGWHELHGVMGGGDERYLHEIPWSEHLAATTRLLRALAPVLRHHKSRINLETHGDVTTAELVRLAEDVGPDVVGICLDTANVLCHAEDPVQAARRAAPYTHLTHIKDAFAFFGARGIRRQTLPPGHGAIPWRTVLPILAEHEPNLPLSIEDHKWLFQFPCFEPRWLMLHPDLAITEFASFMKFVVQCETRRAAGELGDPDADEAVPFASEMRQRLASGAAHLRGLIKELGLHDRPQVQRHRSLAMGAEA